MENLSQSYLQRKYEAAKNLAHLFFEHSPTGVLHEPSMIPFEDTVEVMPPTNRWDSEGTYYHEEEL